MVQQRQNQSSNWMGKQQAYEENKETNPQRAGRSLLQWFTQSKSGLILIVTADLLAVYRVLKVPTVLNVGLNT